MRYKTILCGALAAFLLAGSAGSQTTFEPAVRKPKGSFSSVKLVSVGTTAGKEILVLSGQKASSPVPFQKAARGLAVQFLKAPAAKSKKGAAIESTVVDPGSKILAPGEVLLIGPTGSTTTVSRADTLIVRAPVMRSPSGPSANPLAATVERQIFAGDLLRDTSAASRGLTPGSVAGAPAEVAIGPNGFPIFVGTTAPQSGTNPIGPNGFPELPTTGAQSGIQPIGPNGLPAMNTAPLPRTGLTRAGTPRDATAPAANAPSVSAALPAGASAAR